MRILAVCTGNICRSPAVELVLGSLALPGVTVASAGTRAVVGHEVHAPMRGLLEADGIDSSAFRARQLDRRWIRDADLVLVSTREHRSWVLREEPGALHRTFTVLELARIVTVAEDSVLAPAGWRERLAAAARMRAALRRGIADHEDDIADPFRRSDNHYRAAYGEITASVRGEIARLLTS